MNNKVNLTDNELSLITASLQMTIMSHEKYLENNGDESLDFQAKEAVKSMRKLLERLNKEYF